jgi:hypothetical protein
VQFIANNLTVDRREGELSLLPIAYASSGKKVECHEYRGENLKRWQLRIDVVACPNNDDRRLDGVLGDHVLVVNGRLLAKYQHHLPAPIADYVYLREFKQREGGGVANQKVRQRFFFLFL